VGRARYRRARDRGACRRALQNRARSRDRHALFRGRQRVDATADASSLRTALAEARARDTLTLWNLLPRVDGSERERLYARLAILAPPPKGVTRDKVIALDAHALNLWYDELEYVWY
jgi:hypothetical protein